MGREICILCRDPAVELQGDDHDSDCISSAIRGHVLGWPAGRGREPGGLVQVHTV